MTNIVCHGFINRQIKSYHLKTWSKINKKKTNIIKLYVNEKNHLILKSEEVYFSTIGMFIPLNMRKFINFSYNSKIFSQIIGHLLGDGNLTVTWSSKNAYFIFTQTIIRFEYVWFVFNNIEFLCYSMPRLGSSNRHGKTSYNIQVHTRSYPFLMQLYNDFYIKDNNGKKIKRVPFEMFYWLNPISLAYWAMDDGGNTSSGSGFYLHTKGFNFYDVYYLVGLIHYKFGINCTVQNHKSRPVIYIKSKSKERFIQLIYPYFHKTMLYKLK